MNEDDNIVQVCSMTTTGSLVITPMGNKCKVFAKVGVGRLGDSK